MPLRSIRRPRFLVAHENITLRRFIKGWLHELGCLDAVDWAPGKTILATLLEERADALIVDGETPEMRGWKLLKTMHSLPSTRKTKVIVVSGDSTQETIHGAVRAGVDGYVVLPVSVATLENKIRGLFAGQPA